MAPVFYGLDIETDTSVDGLDPRRSAIVAVAVASSAPDSPAEPRVDRVFDDPDEAVLLRRLDDHLATLEPGVLVTWNGAGFDLPFIADRARHLSVRLGLVLRPDPRLAGRRAPLAGHRWPYRARWYGHRHLDAYQLFRADVGASLGLACGLKAIARLVGLPPVEVDRGAIHELSPAERAEYVLSDARLARALALRRPATAVRAVDP
ncbi:MAG: hypothetical protein D6683_11990 [Actinomyces sp.]|nr:MAG: hypothetical protein D6683_11990 [Actinomyces sp.]